MLTSTCSKSAHDNSTNIDSTSMIDSLSKCDSITLSNSPLNVLWIQKVIAGRDCQFILQGAQLSTCIYNNKIVVLFENPASNLGACQAKVYSCNGTIIISWMDSNWQYLYPSILPTTVSMADILNSSSSNIVYVKHDIFILPNYLELYDKAVVQYAEYPTYGNPFSMLRNKHRIIHNYCKDIEFIEAQYILQTTEYFRSVINN